MAIWQFGLTLIPEEVLLGKFDVLPLQIPEDLAEDFSWWAAVQPPEGFERQIELITPERPSWSTIMRMWGQEDGDDITVCYIDENKKWVERINIRLDAGAVLPELVRKICNLASQLKCVLVTASYEILVPDEVMVLAAINNSVAKHYVDDPVSTLLKLGRAAKRERLGFQDKDPGTY